MIMSLTTRTGQMMKRLLVHLEAMQEKKNNRGKKIIGKKPKKIIGKRDANLERMDPRWTPIEKRWMPG